MLYRTPQALPRTLSKAVGSASCGIAETLEVGGTRGFAVVVSVCAAVPLSASRLSCTLSRAKHSEIAALFRGRTAWPRRRESGGPVPPRRCQPDGRSCLTLSNGDQPNCHSSATALAAMSGSLGTSATRCKRSCAPDCGFRSAGAYRVEARFQPAPAGLSRQCPLHLLTLNWIARSKPLAAARGSTDVPPIRSCQPPHSKSSPRKFVSNCGAMHLRRRLGIK
jgi:hypothetical protein